MCFRDRPRSFGSFPIGQYTFVATTTLSRAVNSFSVWPRNSSLTPREYMSAVSKKLTPASIARLINGRPSVASRTHGRHFGVPYVMHPRHSRDTFKPDEPSRTYSMCKLLPEP